MKSDTVLINLDIKIINTLLDKYERSRIFHDENKRKIRISLKLSDKPFYHYFADDGYLYKDLTNKYLEELAKENLIIFQYVDGELFEISLNLAKIDEAYKYVNRLNLSSFYDELINFIDKNYLNYSIISQNFLQNYRNSLIRRKNPYSNISSLDDLKKVILGIDAIYNNDQDIFMRNFSKKYFLDSKYLENNLSFYKKIIEDNSDLEFDSDDEFLSYFHIFKNPHYTFIKNGLVLNINGVRIDLDQLNYEISLSDEEIEKLEIEEIRLKKLITIENLTTFNYFNNKNYIVLYLAGFPNTSKIKLLKKINEKNNLECFHFGDVDKGGFDIFLSLTLKSEINFYPYLMNEKVLTKYHDYCLKLTSNDVLRLEKAKNDTKYEIFKPTIEYMLINNVKLEQEAIDLEDFN